MPEGREKGKNRVTQESQMGKTKKEAESLFQQERNRMQLEKELGRTEVFQEMIARSKTMDKKAGASLPQEETTFQESTEQRRIRCRGWQR